MDQLEHCTSRPYILQNRITIRPLRHILRIFLDKVPLWGPRGSGQDQNCTCTTSPWGQQHETMNRSLQYLVTEEIEEQDIVYGQTVGRRTKGYCISSTGLRPVELKCFFLPFLIQFDNFTKHNENFSVINNMEYMYIMT